MQVMPFDFPNILDNLNDGLYLVDHNRRITYWNKAAERITGFKREEVIGHFCSDNLLIHVDSDGCDLCTGVCPLAATIGDQLVREVDIFLHHKNGHRLPVSVRVLPLKNASGEVIGACEVFSDARSQNELNYKLAELEKLAYLDPLTGLVNRRYLASQLSGQFALWKRNRTPFGLVFFDIDHFKDFNDAHGHHIGDQALQTVAKTLSASVRPFDIISRWGGEEFVGIFPNATSPFLNEIANRLCMLVRKSWIDTDQGPTRVTISIGGTSPVENDTQETLLQRADTLMYQSKETGRDRVTIG